MIIEPYNIIDVLSHLIPLKNIVVYMLILILPIQKSTNNCITQYLRYIFNIGLYILMYGL